MGKTMNRGRLKRTVWGGLAAALSLLALTERAEAQEILLTGPLAGAPAVRKQRLYREGRFELAPTVSFTLLDEYQRQILVGGRVNYNLTDWLAIGAWGSFSPDPLQFPAGLSRNIQDTNELRREQDPGGEGLDRRLTAVNLGEDFTRQLGSIDWVFAPQLTVVPFRGKIALFQGIYADTDLFFFGGPAFVGVSERGNCGPGTIACTAPESFALDSRVAIAPTFGLGLTFYLSKFMSLGAEWRGLPFSRNTGGFDNRGAGPDDRFPDLAVNEQDRQFKFNQMLTLSLGFSLPTMYRVSE